MSDIKALIAEYNNSCTGYGVAFVNDEGLIAVYDDDDELLGWFTEGEFRTFMTPSLFNEYQLDEDL